MALTLEQMQVQVARAFELIHSLSQELGSANSKIEYLSTQTEELKSAKRQVVDAIQRSSGVTISDGRHTDVKLIDMKAMNPKKYDGKHETPYRAWAKPVRAYCNASKPGFRKFLRWIETQTSAIDRHLLNTFAWEHKKAAADALYDFLVLHTAEDAQQLVELQDEKGPEAWR